VSLEFQVIVSGHFVMTSLWSKVRFLILKKGGVISRVHVSFLSSTLPFALFS